MRKKGLLSALLALALAVSLVLPVGASVSSFSDVAEPTMGVNADVLRLMGVVSGVGSNQFNPDGPLTRAEFATMTVKFMQKGDEAPLYATRTIFSDVTASHWALPYVNMAASISMGGGGGGAVGGKEGDSTPVTAGSPLISGVGNGRFEPDQKIDLAQAATILLRVLGYTSKEAGTVWPQGYIKLAQSIGLTDGVTAKPFDKITRAQAAQLFANALNCKTAAKEPYYKSLGTVTENTIILAVGVKTDDGKSDSAIRTSANKGSESYLAAAGDVKPQALCGKRGALVVNEKNEIVTFVPDASDSITVTLSGEAQPSYIKGTDGQRYTMGKDTIIYTADAQEGKPYLDGYSSLRPGEQVILYSENGKITGVYAQGGTSGDSTSAVVVRGTPNVGMFHQLTGGVDNFKVTKNGQTISMSSLREWDVVTYDRLSNTLIASDMRLVVTYKDAKPNASAPTSINILEGASGTLEVLDSAWDTISKFRLGDQVVLLLTADGKVAGMAKPGGQLRSNAIGLVTGEGVVSLFLPNGHEMELKGPLSGGTEYVNQLVSVSGTDGKQINVSIMGSNGGAGDFRVKEMKLGQYPVASNVRIYERAGRGSVVPVSLSSLTTDVIRSSKIYAYHRNSSNLVDFILLSDATGDGYQYGLLTKSRDVDEEGRTTYYFENGSGGRQEILTREVLTTGFRQAIITAEKNIKDVVELTKVEGVKAADFFESQGESFVKAGGHTYQIGEGVEAYKDATETWLTEKTGDERLSAIKAFSNDFTLYIDPVGDRVRIIVAK